jgi:glyceraldehyde 3-phosphate dehydrogenase
MVVNGDRIRVIAQRDPSKLPWGELGCRGRAGMHRAVHEQGQGVRASAAGAKKVLISAPGGDDVDATIVYGVNHQILKSSHTVVSNASCTTNCLAPLAKVLHDNIGIVAGVMTTIHSYTNDQVLTDVYHSDLRRARSATMSHDSDQDRRGGGGWAGAAGAEGQARRIRDPGPDDQRLAGRPELPAARKTSGDEINGLVKAAANGALKGVLAYNDQPLVSVDFNHDPASSTYDATLTKVIEGTLVKVCCVVRQRMGLLEPHARYDGGLVEGVLNQGRRSSDVKIIK